MSSQKEKALSFFKMVVARDIRNAYQKYTAPNFVHHNPYFKSDRESLLQAMEGAHTQFPNTTFEPKHVYEDGNTVITHSLVKHKPEDAGMAVIHIVRFENGLIAEMWDLAQPIDKNSPNERGPF